jgi:hypothetical protein
VGSEFGPFRFLRNVGRNLPKHKALHSTKVSHTPINCDHTPNSNFKHQPLTIHCVHKLPLLKWRLPKYLLFNILPLLLPRCTIPHVKEPITTLDQISFTSKILCMYAQYGNSNPSTPTRFTDTRKTNAKTATNARFQIDRSGPFRYLASSLKLVFKHDLFNKRRKKIHQSKHDLYFFYRLDLLNMRAF